MFPMWKRYLFKRLISIQHNIDYTISYNVKYIENIDNEVFI